MLYAITGYDVPNSLELRKAARPAHVARLQELQDQGRLILAGPFPTVDASVAGTDGFTGSLIVAEFTNWDDAQAWANADPFVSAGVYQNVIVKPFRKTLPL